MIDRQGAIQIASELRKIGVNVNQIAKHLNSGGNASEGQINAFSAIKKRVQHTSKTSNFVFFISVL